jgi:hypothetical protein
MSTYVYRFVGLEVLPGRLTHFDIQQFFELGTGDVDAIRQRFRSDRRVAVALQLLFLRACGRQMDRFSVLPRNLLRYVAEALEAPPLTIASLRSLYERRPTLYEHQQWSKDYLGLRELDPAAEAAHRVKAFLSGLQSLEFGGCANDPAFKQLATWRQLQAMKASELPDRARGRVPGPGSSGDTLGRRCQGVGRHDVAGSDPASVERTHRSAQAHLRRRYL